MVMPLVFRPIVSKVKAFRRAMCNSGAIPKSDQGASAAPDSAQRQLQPTE